MQKTHGHEINARAYVPYICDTHSSINQKRKRPPRMNLDDLAQLMGKSRQQVEDMLKKSDVIELKLTERKGKDNDENFNIEDV